MLYMTIEDSRTVTVPNFRTLLAAWRMYRDSRAGLRFVVRKPLTTTQARMLPRTLRGRLRIDLQFEAECRKCGEIYADDRPWIYCPVCGIRLETATVQQFDRLEAAK
jgi:hypothetical protein